MIPGILERAAGGERISPEEGLLLLERADLFSLAAAAHRRRMALHPGPLVTFVVDRNVNYTNGCIVGCVFCAFYRSLRSRETYVLSREEVLAKVEELVVQGGTQLLLQGGHHPEIPWDYYLDLLSAIRRRFPSVDIHAFSPPEIQFFSRTFGLPLRRVLEELREAGLSSLPGGGAEILVDSVRRRVSPKKASADEWEEVMRVAAEVGLRATATMMFGHLESLRDRVEHLERVRRIQEDTGVFRAFIPWSFQPKNTRLSHLPSAGGCDYLRTVALSRLYLDNVPHLQASWVTQGPKVGQLALLSGCDDFGGTLLEENVVREAGAEFRLDREEMLRLIRRAGFIPAQRDTAYRIIRIFGEEIPTAGSRAGRTEI